MTIFGNQAVQGRDESGAANAAGSLVYDVLRMVSFGRDNHQNLELSVLKKDQAIVKGKLDAGYVAREKQYIET
jgi:hypothetical protein